MNKVIPTTERVFMCVTGASGTGKTHLILDMLTIDPAKIPHRQYSTFQPQFDHILYFYRHWQSVYNEFVKRLTPNVIEFVEGTGVDVITDIVGRSNPQIKTLMIFDDSCEEILQSVQFANLATSGRHKGLHVIFIKHNMYQQGKYSVTVDKNTTHILMMKSPRIGKQLERLGAELDSASSSFLIDCYKLGTANRFGHLLIDMSPSCNDFLRYSSSITGDLSVDGQVFQPTIFHVPESMISYLKSHNNDEQTNDLYTSFLPAAFPYL